MKDAIIALLGKNMPESFSSVLFSKPQSVLETPDLMTRVIKFLLKEKRGLYKKVGAAVYGKVKGIIGNCWVAPLYDGTETHYAVFEDDRREFYIVKVPVQVEPANSGKKFASHKLNKWIGSTILYLQNEVAVEWSLP